MGFNNEFTGVRLAKSDCRLTSRSVEVGATSAAWSRRGDELGIANTGVEGVSGASEASDEDALRGASGTWKTISSAEVLALL